MGTEKTLKSLLGEMEALKVDDEGMLRGGFIVLGTGPENGDGLNGNSNCNCDCNCSCGNKDCACNDNCNCNCNCDCSVIIPPVDPPPFIS